MTREFRDEQGRLWHAIADEATVAHGKPGRLLAFVPAAEPDAEPLRTSITFNSEAAADFALRTLGEKELRRRLTLSLAEHVGL
jgi:hypothetical protein